MLSRAAVLMMLILATATFAPAAIASHKGLPSLEGLMLSEGANLTLTQEGRGSAKGEMHELTSTAKRDSTYSFDYSYRWNGTFRLTAPARALPGSPDLEGRHTFTPTASGSIREYYYADHRRANGEIISQGDYTGTCSLKPAPVSTTVRAVFLPERASLLVSFPFAGKVPHGWWSCSEQENNYGGQMFPEASPLALHALAPDSREHARLINETVAERLGLTLGGFWGDEEERMHALIEHVVIEVPLILKPLALERARTVRIPYEGESYEAERYCVDPTMGVETTCTWSGVVDWQLEIDPCPSVERSLREHVDLLRGYASPPAAGTREQLFAWRDGVATRIQDVLRDARQLALLCADSTDVDIMPLIAARTAEYQRALVELYRRGDRSPEVAREIASSERQLQLLGFEGSADAAGIIGEIVASPPSAPAGQISVRVHSPVSIHAWREDGAHVGWNGSSGSTDIGIEGATYEGTPGGSQTITLPAGVYRIAADEIDEGSYTLAVSWDAEGAQGEELFPLDAREGRTFTTHYALVENARGVEMEIYPVRRVDTPDAAAFLDGPLRPAPAMSALPAPTGSASQEAPGPTAPSSDAGAAPAPVPMPAWPLLVSLVILALVRRRS